MNKVNKEQTKYFSIDNIIVKLNSSEKDALSEHILKTF